MCHNPEPERHYWLSCRAFTVRVTTDANGYIIDAAPIVRKFRGRHLARLVAWATKLGGMQLEALS